MLLLSVDTSGKNGSIALARVAVGQGEVEVIESVPLAGGTFSAQLIPQISTLLANHRYSKTDLGAFCAASGPGSFTGLRVGLAAIKALAEVLQKPIAAVSLLEAVACSGQVAGNSAGHVLAALDAGRGEVYVGDYEIGGNAKDLQSHMVSERLLSRDALLAEAGKKTVVTPDAGLFEILDAAGVRALRIEYPSGAVIARLGWEKIERGETVGSGELEANYIRRSDAEIFAQPKP